MLSEKHYTPKFLIIQDADGRCYSDSLAELPSILKRKGVDASKIPFSLDEMRRNIDKVSNLTF